MRDTNLVNALREHAEWAQANEWEAPITLGDDLTEAADLLENQNAHIAALQQEIETLRGQLPRWIQVEERLPENGVPVLINYIGSNDGKYHPDGTAVWTDHGCFGGRAVWKTAIQRSPCRLLTGCRCRNRRRWKMLEVCPMTLREANAYVEQYHRHHGPVVGHKFSIGLSDGEKIVGVAIVGRPVARHLDDGWTLEVNRLCTDGTRNACSMLYAAAWRAARAMGYKRLVTYILDTENGASLRAAGWKCIGQAGGLRWTGKRRPEVDLCPAQMKIRFERTEGM